MMSKKSKLICFLAIMLSFSTLLANCNTYKIINSTSLATSGGISNTLLITTKSGKTVLSNINSDDYFLKNIDTLMTNLRYKSIDYIFVFNYNDEMQANLSKLANHYYVNKIFILGEYSNSTKIGLTNEVYSANILEWTTNSEIKIESDDLEMQCYTSDNKTKAVVFDVDNTKTIQILYSISQDEIDSTHLFGLQYDCLFANRFVERYFEISSREYFCKTATNISRDVEIIVDNELWTYNF